MWATCCLWETPVQDSLIKCEEDVIFILHQVNGNLTVIEISKLAQQACHEMLRFTHVPEDSLGRVYQQNHFMLQEDVTQGDVLGEENSGLDKLWLSVLQAQKVLEGVVYED